MSGHNKWSQIKHKKAATDGERSRLFAKYAKLITLESRLAAGNTESPTLTAAIERAKRDAMPKENIERAIAKGLGTHDINMQSVLFEAFGPGGVAILITAVTDNNNRTSQELKHIFTKQGFALGAPGSALWAFQKNSTGYSPTSPLTLSISDEKILSTLIEKIMLQDDVQEIYTTTDEGTVSRTNT
jgi:YebC/PmpR family DNA-binding regulatory protein